MSDHPGSRRWLHSRAPSSLRDPSFVLDQSEQWKSDMKPGWMDSIDSARRSEKVQCNANAFLLLKTVEQTENKCVKC